MYNFIGAWIFVAGLIQISSCDGASVNVTVLYESLCPDSMWFIRKQLYPAYEDLKEFVNVEFVPFGKALYATNPWRITCQHGLYECKGNAVQACALARYPDNEMQVKFIHCVMSDDFPPTAGSKCASRLNYHYDGIEECARSEEGRQMLSQMGDRTQNYKRTLSFVPTIIINDEFSEEDQTPALRNLKSLLCKKLGEPKQCRNE